MLSSTPRKLEMREPCVGFNATRKQIFSALLLYCVGALCPPMCAMHLLGAICAVFVCAQSGMHYKGVGDFSVRPNYIILIVSFFFYHNSFRLVMPSSSFFVSPRFVSGSFSVPLINSQF